MPGLIHRGVTRERSRKGWPQGTGGCSMTRSRTVWQMTDRERHLLREYSQTSQQKSQHLALSCSAVAISLPSGIQTWGHRQTGPAEEALFGPTACATMPTYTVVKHLPFTFPGSGSVSHPSSRNCIREVWGDCLCRFGEFWQRGHSQTLLLWWWRRQAQAGNGILIGFGGFPSETQHPWSARWMPITVKHSNLQKGSNQWRDWLITLIKGH